MSSFPTNTVFQVFPESGGAIPVITLEEVRIMEFSMNTAASKESPHSRLMECHVEGEALYQGQTDEESAATRLIRRIRSYISAPRPKVKLYVRMDTTATTQDRPKNWTIYDWESTTYRDSQLGPYLKIMGTQIVGTNAIIVKFSLDWTQSRNESSPLQSLYTKATFSIDETGATTIRKVGSVEVAIPIGSDNSYPKLPSGSVFSPLDSAGAPNSQSSGNPLLPPLAGDAWRNDVVLDRGPNKVPPFLHADFLRTWVAGNMYPGFRRVAQEYAIDESGRRLIFDVIDKEFHRGLPAPAKVGNCQFTFERSIDDKNQAIGIKHFIASVKGDRNVTIGNLLTLCIRLSENRIDYANDLIVKVRVTEENMLTENAVSFEVAAKATSLQTFTPGTTSGNQSGGSSTLVPPSGFLLRNILSPIIIPGSGSGQPQRFDFVPAQMPYEYGVSGILRYVTNPFDNRQDANAYDGSTLQLSLPDTEDYTVTYYFPNSVFDIIDGQDAAELDPRFRYRVLRPVQVPSGPNSGDMEAASVKAKTQEEKDAASKAIASAYESKHYTSYSVRTGIVDCPPVSGSAETKVFQLSAPRVMKNDTIEAAAKNRAPERPFNDEPGNQPSLVGSFDINVSSGAPDINGNRVLTSVMTRDARLLPPADIPPGPGPCPSNPDWQVVAKGTGDDAFLVVQYNPQAIPMPLSETQGVNTPETKPSYNASVTNPIRYLT